MDTLNSSPNTKPEGKFIACNLLVSCMIALVLATSFISAPPSAAAPLGYTLPKYLEKANSPLPKWAKAEKQRSGATDITAQNSNEKKRSKHLRKSRSKKHD